jgi:outer membrane protein OmpA-like peptidoglycan-associated protein
MLKFAGIVLLICGMAVAQEANPTSQPQQPSGNPQADTSGSVPLYRISVVDRTIKAINYFHRSGETPIAFSGTTLLPDARGSATVESRRGRMVIDAKFDHLQPPNRFGPEYLTYVLWAITPEGRPQNLGEILLDGSKSAINVTTDLQAFGLIVTAEPYYAVTQPSDVVVLENQTKPETTGKIEQVDAKYELLPRGQYVASVNPANLTATKRDHKVPLELEEARNAIQLAEAAQAGQYAQDSLQKARTELQNAEGLQKSHGGSKQVITAAREAVQHAEDARVITLRKMRQEQAQKEREQMQQQQAEAQARAAEATRQQQEEAARRSQAETDRQAAEAAKAQAEQAKAEAETATQRAQQEREQSEAARQAALQQQQQLQAQAQQAQQAAQTATQRAQQAEAERAQLRERLRQQLNTILATRESAKGLIVNMSDVLFDTGKYTLKPGAREKLAKVAGILLAYPGLKVQIEGFTDNVGGDEYNQRLSEQRAMTVRDYLVQQGINLNNVTAQGFGKGNPVASNATPSGRQQNRRVELVVSGEPIDVNAGMTPGAQPAGAPAATGTEANAPAATNPNTEAAPATSGLPQSDQEAQPSSQPAPGTSAAQPQPAAVPPQAPGTTAQPANTQQPNTAPTIPK